MILTDYKGYTICVNESDGFFTINDVHGRYETLTSAKSKIDTILKAEVKGVFPVPAITKSFYMGKITSANLDTQYCQFTREDGQRRKERILDYSGRHQFFVTNQNNIALYNKYQELTKNIQDLQIQLRALEDNLTEPIKELYG